MGQHSKRNRVIAAASVAAAAGAVAGTTVIPAQGATITPGPVKAELLSDVTSAAGVSPDEAATMMAAMHPASVATATYTVRSGDSLSAIARRICGAASKWPVLWTANRRTVGANPNLIFPRQVLRATCAVVGKLLSYSSPARPAEREGSSTQAPVTHAAPVVHVSGVSGGTLGCGGLEALWDSAGGNPADAVMAASIAMAESGGNQYAVSPTDDIGYWQINRPSWGAMATTDPVGNARAAIQISSDGTNWSPWTTYTSGAYAGRC